MKIQNIRICGAQLNILRRKLKGLLRIVKPKIYNLVSQLERTSLEKEKEVDIKQVERIQ